MNMVARAVPTRVLALTVLATGAVWAAQSAPATAATASTALASVASDGPQANNLSYHASLSADGRYVAFASYASNLTPDSNAVGNVYVRDLQTGRTELVSQAAAGGAGDAMSSQPAISADGRYVVFASQADDLVPGGTTGRQVFVRDLQTGRTELVSRDSAGTESDGDNAAPTVSGSGRYVAFASDADNLTTEGTRGQQDVYVRDRTTGRTTLVSRGRAGGGGDGLSESPRISANGRFVAFASQADNLVAGDTGRHEDVFVTDLTTGVTSLVSCDSAGVAGNADSRDPSISRTGQRIAFLSFAGNLAPGDTNNDSDVFVRDTGAGQTRVVSVGTDDAASNGQSFEPAISGDGNRVAFESVASDLAAPHRTGLFDVFLRDLTTGRTTVVSRGATAADPGNGSSDLPSLSGTGRVVAFDSAATNLVAGDGNGQADVFVRNLAG